MKKIWSEILQEIILAILTLGISTLKKGKKRHEKKREQLQDPSDAVPGGTE